MPSNRSAGFTLIEVMITLVIISILVGIAYPSYRNWTIQTRRSDAEIALTQTANRLEKYFYECNTYVSTVAGTWADCGGGLEFANTLSPDGHYLITIAAGTIAATCGALTCGYTITANPNGAGTTPLQNGDGKFRIDSTGVKRWDKADDNSYGYKWTDK